MYVAVRTFVAHCVVTLAAFAAAVLLAFAGPVRADPCVAPVVVEGHGVPAHVVDELATIAPGLMARAAIRTGASSCAPVQVALLPGIEGAAHLDPPWVLPTWAAGAAVPEERRVVIAITANGRRQDRERILLHELAHVAVRDAARDEAAPNVHRVPRWLDEGIARVIAGEHGADDLSVLARARVADRMLPLAALEDGFPGRADLAQLAYAQSGRAVSLIEELGPEALPSLLAGIATGESVDEALFDATGRRTWQLELDVERSIPLWRAWAVVGFETDLALGAAGLMCAWAGIRSRRRYRQRLHALDDDERVPEERRAPPLDVVLARWTVSLQQGTAS